MTTSDPTPRTREDFSPDALAQRAADKVREVQEAHLQIVDLLETAYGLDIDALVAIYGDRVLDGTVTDSTETLKRWQQLYEALGSQDKYLAVANTHRETAPGCYGYGAKARYESRTRLSVFKDPRETQVVSEVDDAGKPRLVLRGLAAYHDYPEERGNDNFEYLKKFTMQDVVLAGSDRGFTYPENHLGIAVHASTLPKLYDALGDYHPYSGYSQMRDSSMMWLFNAVRGR